MLETASTLDAKLEAAKWYIELGGTLAACWTGKKHPKGPTGPNCEEWQTYRHEDMTDAYLLDRIAGAQTFGILTGIPRGPIILDIDDATLIDVIRERLPPTPMAVRSRKGLHLWFGQGRYTVPNLPRGGMFDLLAEKRFAIVAPSAHPQGGAYELAWDRQHFEALGIMNWSELPALEIEHVEWLAGFSRHAPHLHVVPGDIEGNLSGLAAPREPVSDAPLKGENSGRNNRLSQLVGAWIAEGDLHMGSLESRAQEWNLTNEYPLSRIEVAAVVTNIMKTHVTSAVKNGRALPVPVVEADTSNKPPVLWSRPLKHEGLVGDLLVPPVPVLNDFVEYVHSMSIQRQPVFAVQAALALGSVIAGRRYITADENTSALYVLNVGDSGSGKDIANKCVEKVLLLAGFEKIFSCDGFTGGTAVYDVLADSPTKLMILDEFGDVVSISNKSQNGNGTDTMRSLRMVFSAIASTYSPKSFSNNGMMQKRGRIMKPSLSILASTTPGQFHKAIKSENLENGLVSRFLIAQSNELEKDPLTPIRVDPPQHIIDHIKMVRPMTGMNVVDNHDLPPHMIMVEVTKEANDIYNALALDLKLEKQKHKDENIAVLFSRTREKAMRLAVILAVFENPEQPLVTAALANWACRYVWACDTQTASVLKDRLSTTDYSSNRQDFLRSIRDAGASGVTSAEMGRTTPFRSFKERDRNEILADLKAAGLIGFIVVPTGGRPRQAYIALSEDEE